MSPAPASEIEGTSRRVRRNFGIVLSGNVSAAAMQWLVVVAIAKLGDATMLGQYAFALAVAAPVLGFASLQLRAIQVADQTGRYRFSEYFAVRVATTTTGVLAIAAYALSLGGEDQQRIVLMLIACAKGVDLIADVYFGRWQQSEDMRHPSLGLVLNTSLTLVLVTVLLALTQSLVVALWGSLGASLVALMYIVRASHPINLRDEPRRGLPALRRLVAEGAPLGAVLLLVALHANIPRYFVQWYLGHDALGLFAAASQLPLAGGVVVASLGAAASPRLARCLAAGERERFDAMLWKLIAFVMLIGCCGVGLSMALGSDILAALYRPGYRAGARLLTWLSVAAVFSFGASLLGYGMTIAGRLRIQPAIFVTVACVHAAGCWYLIPLLGAEGAGPAALIASVLQFVLCAAVLARVPRGGPAAVPSCGA